MQKFEDVKKVIAPAGAEVNSNYLKLGDKFVKSFFVLSYPRFLSTGWFEPLINLPHLFDISIFVNPIDTNDALKNLRKKAAQIESQINDQQDKGMVRDPMLETALKDVEGLRDTLQQAREKLFSTGVYIAVYADTLEELAKLESKITSMMETQLVYVKTALFEQLEGFFSVLPIGEDKVSVTTPMNSEPISSFFPFISEDLTSDKGIMYGINRYNNNLVIFDRFSLENANQVVFAKSGSGKSIVGTEPVLIKKNGLIQLKDIGSVVEEEIATYGAEKIDDELEGVIEPDLHVWSFDKNLKGSWSKVSVAARKDATEDFYSFTTQSGRTVTTTGDHNMLVLRNGEVVVAKSTDVKAGEYIPLPRHITPPEDAPQVLNLLELLANSKRIYIKNASALIDAHYASIKNALLDPALDRYLYRYRTGRVMPIHYFIAILTRLGIGTNDPLLGNIRITSKSNKSSLPIHFEITEPLLKILGYITAEGHLTEGTALISNLDQEVLNDIASACRALGIAYFFANRGVVIAERPFVELVRALGVGGKSDKKRVPPFVFGLHKKLIAEYLSAYFEGDGGVETGGVTATSKSRALLSDIAYLFYYFGVVGRITETHKKAQGWVENKTYWRFTVSGQENVMRFSSEINFISQRKRRLLAERPLKQGNTNVDVVPETHKLFNELYELFSFGLHGLQDISALKRESYHPSPEQLTKVIRAVEERIAQFEVAENRILPLRRLPALSALVEAGAENKVLNARISHELGDNWRLMKQGKITPGLTNVLKVAHIITGEEYSMREVKEAIHYGFDMVGLEIKSHNRSLQSALVDRPESSTSYKMIWDASSRVLSAYQDIIVDKIPRIQAILSQLKMLAGSDLFWDPIVKIEKKQNTTEKYVYDLTVDNEVFLAGSGGMFVHNSYSTKLEIIRQMMMGLDVIVIDPENEYQRLAEAFGGSFFNISLSSPEHINPFDIPIVPENELPGDVLRSHIVNIAGLLKLMLGKISPEEDGILDRAITETYASREIVPGEDFSNRQPPLLEDLETVLRNLEGGLPLAERLYKYTRGSFSGFINQPSNVDINNRLIVFSIRDLEDELRPIAMYVVLNFIWNLIRARLTKRIMIIDEAWWMMKEESSASFLFGLAKRARKYYLGISTITQDVEDFLRSPYGRPIITNSSLQLLLKQAPSTIDVVAKAFDLTDMEKNLLLSADVGTGLFFAGRQHVAIQIVPSFFEDKLITTDPKQLLEEKQNLKL